MHHRQLVRPRADRRRSCRPRAAAGAGGCPAETGRRQVRPSTRAPPVRSRRRNESDRRIARAPARRRAYSRTRRRRDSTSPPAVALRATSKPLLPAERERVGRYAPASRCRPARPAAARCISVALPRRRRSARARLREARAPSRQTCTNTRSPRVKPGRPQRGHEDPLPHSASNVIRACAPRRHRRVQRSLDALRPLRQAFVDGPHHHVLPRRRHQPAAEERSPPRRSRAVCVSLAPHVPRNPAVRAMRTAENGRSRTLHLPHGDVAPAVLARTEPRARSAACMRVAARFSANSRLPPGLSAACSRVNRHHACRSRAAVGADAAERRT